MELWNKVKQPPKDALKQIGGGRLKGMTDISPQWRYQIMTEIYGPIGTGWTFCIRELWAETYGDEVMAFAQIDLLIEDNKSIPGIGGSKLVTKESKGLHYNDEAYKMAVTDAVSVAMKMLGVGADVYAGKWDGSKYKDTTPAKAKEEPAKKADPVNPPETKAKKEPLPVPEEGAMSTQDRKNIYGVGDKKGISREVVRAMVGYVAKELDCQKNSKHIVTALVGVDEVGGDKFDNWHEDFISDVPIDKGE